MTNRYFEHTYFNTYYYANIVGNVLTGDSDTIGFISNFFSSNESVFYLARPFQKTSAFHLFIEHLVNEFFYHDMDEFDREGYAHARRNRFIHFTPYASSVLNNYGIQGYSFEGRVDNYGEVVAYHEMLTETGILLDLFQKIADEVFYLMFNNRVALAAFNGIVASEMLGSFSTGALNNWDKEEAEVLQGLFTTKGTLRRSRIPEWCKRAVFFRDRGKCCLCPQDLSGILRVSSEKHFDHIVSLAEGGLNDVANLQLLCSTCNLKKSSKSAVTSNAYERWY